jgi:hypothetical protein
MRLVSSFLGFFEVGLGTRCLRCRVAERSIRQGMMFDAGSRYGTNPVHRKDATSRSGDVEEHQALIILTILLHCLEVNESQRMLE